MATGKVGNVVFYADDPPALAAFWAAVFGVTPGVFEGALKEQLLASGLTEAQLAKRGLVEDPSGGSPRLFFHHAAHPKEPGQRNRIHLDVQATPGRHPTPEELEAEKDRLVALGAEVVRVVDQEWGPWHEHYYQLRDPEGNEFCLQ
jgi:catechol 2,3-dioxygenase-like lactoylglutathione lyase family enzyme